MQIDPKQPLPRVSTLFFCRAAPDRVWRVRRVTIAEGLSRPYEIIIDLVCDEAGLDPDSLLGADCELDIVREVISRSFKGIIARVELLDRREDQQPIRLVIVPALRLLEQRVDTRLWQAVSAVEVIEEVLGSALAEFGRELDCGRLRRSYPVREYIVQYHESDLDFVARLLEDEGVSYHFDHDHDGGGELLLLADSSDDWPELPTLDGDATLHIIATREDQAELESIQRLSWDRAVRPTAVVRRTFDWLHPSEPGSAQASVELVVGPRREVYCHGRVVEPDPDRRVIRELADARHGARVLRGIANLVGLAPGTRFRVAGEQRAELDGLEFLVIGTRIHADYPEVSLGESGGDSPYTVEFECVVFDGEPWRPPLSTPKPRVHGPQTALVAGPEGEEIHTDEQGRIKVLFDWDRQHSRTDDSSMWIRVAHAWAGAGFGALFIPRVGMEVVVEFIEGDPDRPLVTGCVYNGESQASVALPEAKTQSTIRTRSSPGGQGFNELRFEDAAGAEQIFVHAQRDLFERIRRNHTTEIGQHLRETVRGDHQQTVHGEQTLVVDGTRTETVRADEIVNNEQSRHTTVYGEETLEVFDHTATLHHAGLARTIKGIDETVIYPNGDGDATARLEVHGELDYRIDDDAVITAGRRVELIQGMPASRVQAVMADGSFGLDAEREWRGSSGTKAQLIAGTCLELSASDCAELRQGQAAIRIVNDVVHIDARELRITVGGNEFVIADSGLTSRSSAVDFAALGAITIKGASVTID